MNEQQRVIPESKHSGTIQTRKDKTAFVIQQVGRNGVIQTVILSPEQQKQVRQEMK